MNRIKQTSTLLLSALLVVVLVLGIMPALSLGEVAEKSALAETAEARAEAPVITTVVGDSSYIYFDLAAGSVSLGTTTYSGSIYVDGVITPVSGNHTAGNKYYIYQSSDTLKTKTGYETTYDENAGCRIPVYPRVQMGDQSWAKYITNNINVKLVSTNWETAANNAGRQGTKNRISFAAGATYDTTIDNIWSTYYHASVARTTGGITAHLGSTKNTNIQIKLKGDSRFGNIHYHSYPEKNNQIVFFNGDSDTNPGSVTVADLKDAWQANHWCSVIGGNDNSYDKSDGIVIESGVIYAGATAEDNCTAIGGGGNEYGRVTINNGKVTAVAATTGTAIGGGIGWGSPGGNADVTINGGEVYAYNFGVDNSSSDKFQHYVPAVAIGGGSSQDSSGNTHTTVTITGGFVYAQCMGGAAIGGGGSAKKNGGGATINISGGTIIAKSTSGKFKGTADPDVVDIDAGVSIGGGTGKLNGGSVTLNISGGILRTGSIGGGKSNGGGLIGGANVKITGGNIVGQIIMAGSEKTSCSFTMIDGTLHNTNLIAGNTIEDVDDPQPTIPITYIEKNGGAVWMEAPNGKTTISGGSIECCSAENGGAIYMTGGTFEISGTGMIINNSATQNGGGVYIGGGTVKVEGGSINNNSAGTDGGAMYVGAGVVNVTGGTINNNTASQNGGGAYIAGNYSMTGGEVLSNKATNGGGIYVNDGLVTMYGGKLDSNTATESGGGMFISSTSKAALVDIFSGSVSSNKAKSGAGVSVVSESDMPINVTVGVQCVHPDLTSESFTPFEYPTDAAGCGTAHIGHTNHIAGLIHSSCPKIRDNLAENNGGGFLLKSAQTNLVFYCVSEGGNIASGKKQCYDMDVQGGNVEIGDKSYVHGQTDPVKGNIVMEGTIWVEGGTVDIYGKMENPQFISEITVDIKSDKDHFIDHRKNESPANPSPTDVVYYKVHYYENFKIGGETIGTYKAFQYPDAEHKNSADDSKYDFTVISSIFSREGYKIVGWNTNQNWGPNDPSGKFFEVNATYNLKDLVAENLVDTEESNNLLILYAIWEVNTYALKFEPNVGTGGSYSGTMENQIVRVSILDGSQKINLNQYKRPGYKFVGWTLNPNGEGVVYENGHTIVENFTIKDGDLITLYAQWVVCDHYEFLVYTVNDAGNVLTQTCSNCGRHTATATLFSVNSSYDGNKHTAMATFSANWLGDEPIITYTMAPSEWDSNENDTAVEEWNVDPTPLHAGSYTAKIAVNSVEAHTDFTISPIKWATPDIPKIVFKVVRNAITDTEESVIEISTPKNDETNKAITYLYRITYLKDDIESSVVGYEDWQGSNQFAGVALGHYYYFHAKQCADRDHIESEPSCSEAYLATGGNIVFFKNATGIKVEPDMGGGSFKYIVSAEQGYHLRGYTDNRDSAVENATIVNDENGQPMKDESGNPIVLNKAGIRLTVEPAISPEVGTYTYTVEFDNGVAYHQITLEFSGAVKNAYVAHKVTDGQVFGNFNDKMVTISRDSAFTAQLTLVGYYLDEYNAPTLSFSKTNVDNTLVNQALPAKTTIIMLVDGKYWYYNLDTAKAGISLTEFTAMGGTEKYFFGSTDGTTSSLQTTTYQFIIDFSQVDFSNAAIDYDNLNVILGMTAKSTNIANIPEMTASTENKQYVSISIKSSATFELGIDATVIGKSATISSNYTPSEGAASIWNGRKSALVLIAPETAPADLTLTAVIGINTALYTMNADRVFIIPLEGIDDTGVQITLNSKLFKATAETLTFTAKWYVSLSAADISPLNGYLAYTRNDITFSCTKDPATSVRIDGTKRLYHAGDVLEVTVTQAAIPSGATATTYLHVKTDGTYVDTAAKPEITAIDENTMKAKFNIGRMDEGSYRILVVVRYEGANILEVPYYFVIT